MDLIWIEKQYGEMVTLTEKWANLNSHSYNKEGNFELRKKIKEEFLRLAPDVTKEVDFSNSYSLLMKKRSNAPIQIYLGGHMDTVFPKESTFQKAVFSDRDTLKGPGVTDMKGGLVVLLKALEAFEQMDIAENIGWTVFINSDEEIGSPESGPFIQELGKPCNLALLFEPALPNGSIVSARKGSSNYKARARGKTAHMGRNPQEGLNAIHLLIQFIHSLELFEKDGHLHIGQIKGGTSFNVVPDYAECWINLRTFEMEKWQKKILESAKKFNIEIERMTYRPPKPLDIATAKVLEHYKKSLEKIGYSLSWEESGGVCDGNLLAEKGPVTLDSLGVLGKNIHTEEETLYLPSLKEKALQAAFFLGEIAKGNIPIPVKVHG